MNADPLRAMRHRLRQHRLALIAQVCRYAGVETRQQLRELLTASETPIVAADGQAESKRRRAETDADNAG
jgi:hypothetical protein